MADPYGIDLLLSDDGDLVVSPSGDITTITGAMNCAQTVVQRLRTRPGELPLHLDWGSTLDAIVGTKALDETIAAAYAANEARALIDSDRRFLAVRDVQAQTAEGDVTRVAVRITLALALGEEVTVGDVATPRLDEVLVDDASTLADFDSSGDAALLDGLEDAAEAYDPEDETPELEEFLGEEDGTIYDPDSNEMF